MVFLMAQVLSAPFLLTILPDAILLFVKYLWRIRRDGRRWWDGEGGLGRRKVGVLINFYREYVSRERLEFSIVQTRVRDSRRCYSNNNKIGPASSIGKM